MNAVMGLHKAGLLNGNSDMAVKATEGLRYNEGKLRYDLFEPHAMEQLAKVFTRGAQKYAPRNWEKGMSWMSVLASLKRHTTAWEKGEDYDSETGLPHMAHAAWNALALVSYMKIAPKYDDRNFKWMNFPKIGLDIDDVICDWTGAWAKKFGHPQPSSWQFSYKTSENFQTLGDELHEFFLNIPPKISPEDVPFEPHAYITARSVPIELTKEWIEKHGFPTAPVYSVGFGQSKVDVAKQSGIDIFVDDRFENFVELNKAGIVTYLLTTNHNKRYDVGSRRVNSLKELFERFK